MIEEIVEHLEQIGRLPLKWAWITVGYGSLPYRIEKALLDLGIESVRLVDGTTLVIATEKRELKSIAGYGRSTVDYRIPEWDRGT